MCFSFFRAQGIATGDSLVEDEGVEPGGEAARRRARLRLRAAAAGRPRDRRRASPPTPSAASLDGDEVPEGWMGLDIGPRTRRGVRARDRGGRDRVLERADGRLRAGAVRRRHPRRSPRRSPGAGVHRGRRRRLRRGAGGVRARRRGRLAVDRRRRLAGADGGQGAARGGGADAMPDARPQRRWSRRTGRCTRRPPRPPTSSSASSASSASSRRSRSRSRRRSPRCRAAVEHARRSPVRVAAQNVPRGRAGGVHRRGLDPDARRARGRRRDRRPLRAPPALRRDRRGAGAQAAGAARRRTARRSSASARPRPSATPSETEAVLRRQLEADLAAVDDARPRAARDRLRADLGDRHRPHGDPRAGRGGDRRSSARCSPPATPRPRPRCGSSTAAR